MNPTFDGSIQLENDHKRSTDDVAQDLRKNLRTSPVLKYKINSGSSGISGDDNRSVQFVVRGNKSYRELKDVAHIMTASLYSSGKIMGVTSKYEGHRRFYC